MLRDVNVSLNRVDRIRRLTTRKERLDSFARLRIELKTPKEFSWSLLDVVTSMGKPDELAKLEPHRVRRLLGDQIPAFEKMSDANDRALQHRRIVRLACALAEFKLANGAYPRTLADLAPKSIAAIPDDLFNGQPLVYMPAKDGYLLYSVGANGKDDGGKTYGDEPFGSDDLVVRIPLPMLKKE